MSLVSINKWKDDLNIKYYDIYAYRKNNKDLTSILCDAAGEIVSFTTAVYETQNWYSNEVLLCST